MLAAELFDLPESLKPFASFFKADVHPWEWLPQIQLALKNASFAESMDPALIPAGVKIEGNVYIHPTVRLPHFAVIQGPAWIGPETEIRPFAYIRGNVIVGAHCVIGNSSEYKNCLLMDHVETPHYNYVGDSILGNRAHLGAGAVCANLKLARDEVIIRIKDQRFPTGLRKVGAFMGDGAEAGCNSVLQPGTILGKRSAVISMPFHGYLPPETLAIPENRYKTIPR